MSLWRRIGLVVAWLPALAWADPSWDGSLRLTRLDSPVVLRTLEGKPAGELRSGSYRVEWIEGESRFRFVSFRDGSEASFELPGSVSGRAPGEIDATASELGQGFNLKIETAREWTGRWMEESLRRCVDESGRVGEQVWRREWETFQEVYLWRFRKPTGQSLASFRSVVGYGSEPGETYALSGCLVFGALNEAPIGK